jgi:hypothetical protein
MTTQDTFDQKEASRRRYTAPYTSNHPVPTVQRYREHRHELANQQKEEEQTYDNENDGKLHHAVGSIKKIFLGEEHKHPLGDPYPAGNRNDAAATQKQEQSSPVPPAAPAKDKHCVPHSPEQQENHDLHGRESGNQNAVQNGSKKDSRNNSSSRPSATEANAGITDPRQKRKNMKHMRREDGGREVIDPVTHLPVIIYDSTDRGLEKAPQNEPAPGSQPQRASGSSGAQKSKPQVDDETRQVHDAHEGMQKMFPPPSFEDTQAELKKAYEFALTVGLTSIATFATLVLVVWQLLALTGKDTKSSGSSVRHFVPVFITVFLSAVIGFSVVSSIRGWLGKKVEEIWQDEIWDAARSQETEEIESRSLPESTQWLNSLLASIWPLINPDLFTSLADMLEDVMQASLPKTVRMISVDDLGQGSEAFRVLGVKWLPTGAASQSVDVHGNLKPIKNQETSNREAPGEGEVEGDEELDDETDTSSGEKDGNSNGQQEQKQKDQEKEATAEGLEAEQGKFHIAPTVSHTAHSIFILVVLTIPFP